MTTAWPEVALGDVARIDRSGIAPEVIPSGVMYVGLENITSAGEFVGHGPVEPGDLASQKFRFSRKHVLYGKLRPYLCKIAAPDFAGVCSTDILPIQPSDRIDRRYLLHVLRQPSMVAKASSLASGANLPRISPTVLSGMRIPLPPIEAQRRIAAILDQADELRAKRRASLALLDSLTESIFLDTFGAYSTLKSMWPLRRLDQCTQAINDCPHSTPAWTNRGVICLRTSNLGAGRWSWSDTRHVSEATYDLRSKRGELSAGDIVLSREGTVGIAAIVPPGSRMCMGQRLVQVRPDLGQTTPEFLLQWLLMALAPMRISRTMVGSTAQHLNVGELRSLPVPIPPRALQQAFAMATEHRAGVEQQQGRSHLRLDNLFASLQHRAFRGEL